MNRIVFISAFLFAMIAVSGDVHAQRKLPGSVQQAPQAAQNAAKPRFDPYKNFRFRLAYSAQGTHVAGFQEIVVKGEGPGTAEHRGKITGLNKNTDVTLKRGVVHTDSSFSQWIGRAKAPAKPQIKDVVIDTFDEAGRKSSSMQLSGCVVAEYQGMPDLDGPANSARVEYMKLHCASLKRASQ